MSLDQAFRKSLVPVDSRGLRGVFSRGKPQYGHIANVPRPGKHMFPQIMAQNRLRRGLISNANRSNNSKRFKESLDVGGIGVGPGSQRSPNQRKAIARRLKNNQQKNNKS